MSDIRMERIGTAELYCGDVLAVLATLPDESVHCVVTSPPYWGLRDYGTGTWEGGSAECDHRGPPLASDKSTLGSPAIGGHGKEAAERYSNGTGMPFREICGKCGARRIDQQIGLEETPEQYVAKMVAVFREVRRVLRADGTAWVNLGDSYVGGGRGFGGEGTRESARSEQGRIVGPPTGAIAGLKPKDLVGIPWRVAFALQQPYEVVKIRDHRDRAWLAALIDGEGCITTTVAQPTTGINESYAIVLQVRMSDRECLDRIVQITGMSKVQDESLSPSMQTGNQRPASCWKIAGENAATVLAEIYPYLLIKRRQAKVAWNLQRLKDGITTKRGVAIPPENMELRRELHRVIRALNQREVVEVPDWCHEPEYTIEPGWYLRSDCIWSKPNPMPESVTDRPTKAHEYLFLLSKSARYFYDADAVREAHVDPDRGKGEPEKIGKVKGGTSLDAGYSQKDGGWADSWTGVRQYNPAGRNRRTVWTIATEPFPGAHFATFPRKLVQPCILAGCPEHACPKCGAPWVREVEKSRTFESGSGKSGNPINGKQDAVHGGGETLDIRRGPVVHVNTIGEHPTCACGLPAVGGTVLDPFGGSGTTAEVALEYGRHAILIDLKPEYVELQKRRLTPVAGRPLLPFASGG